MCHWIYARYSCYKDPRKTDKHIGEVRLTDPKKCDEVFGGSGGRYCWPIREPTPEEKAATLVEISEECDGCQDFIAHCEDGIILCYLLSENANESINALRN
ncbi:hypothetical protein EAF00_000069 [Botryotinia globosa]|nr:hypothetical protein EAF00_000069 [Botryotinia globosa]